MNHLKKRLLAAQQTIRGMTLMQMLVAAALASMVLASVATLWLFSSRSFVSLANYADLDGKSRYALDCMLRDIRAATQVVDFQNSGASRWLTVTNTQVARSAITYSWNSTSRNLVCQKMDDLDRTYLTECDLWDFQLYQRTPRTNGAYSFYPATNAAGVFDPSLCKLINMTWKCSRTILGNKLNTENVQTAQVVLRNKQ